MKGLVRTGLAVAIVVGLGQAARAADWLQNLVEPAPQASLNADPVELGTGWYLRGDAGLGFDTLPPLSGDSANKSSMSAWSVDLGVGYKVNNWLRFDAGLDMRKVQNNNVTSLTLPGGGNIICPYLLQAVYTNLNNVQTPLGYLWSDQAGTCKQTSTAELHSMAALLNGYVDLGTWHGVTPYVGAGIGVARLASASSLNYYKTSDGTLWAPVWTQTAGYPLVWVNTNGTQINPTIPGTNTPVPVAGSPNWAKKLNATRYNFAWALMAGFAYDLTERAKLDVGFRYLNLGTYQTLPGVAAAGSGVASAKEIKVGFRYMID